MEMLLWFVMLLLFVTFLMRKKYSNSNIPQLQVKYSLLFKLRLSKIFSDAYKQCQKRNIGIGKVRLFSREVIFISDLEVLKEVVLNSGNFRNRGSYYKNYTNLENVHLFNLRDDEWDKARKLLGKYFSNERLKSVLDIFDTYAKLSMENIDKKGGLLDIFQVAHQFSLNVASYIFLGQEQNSCDLNMKNFEKLYNPGLFNKFVDVFGYVCPSLLQWFNICDIPGEVFQTLKSILLEVKMSNKVLPHDSFYYQILNECELENIEQVIGFMIGLIVGSLKSTTTFAAYACYEIAKSPRIQAKLHKEICDLQETNEISFASITKMNYMKNVLNETLRLHSGGPLLIRECNMATNLKLNDNTYLNISEGNLICASLQEILKDGKYFPEPMVFKPERFDYPQTQNCFHPFGIGRHTCIGNRFVMLQVQIFLIRLLTHYDLSVSQSCDAMFLNSQGIRLREGIMHLQFNSRQLITVE